MRQASGARLVIIGTLRGVAAAGVAVVASLHQVHLAMAYADRIVALRSGTIVEDAPAAGFDARAIGQIYDADGAAPDAVRRGTLGPRPT